MWARIAIALGVLIAGQIYSVSARAATFSIGCTGTSADATALISAIAAANDETSNPGLDTISLSTGCVYTFNAVDNWWFGPNALPAISSDITIAGHGATLAVAKTDAIGNSIVRLRFFYVSGGLTTLGRGSLTLNNLTARDGIAKGGDAFIGGGGAGMGGAIFNQGDLVLDGVTLTGNRAIGGSTTLYSTGSGGGGMGEDADAGTDGGGFGGDFATGPSGGFGLTAAYPSGGSNCGGGGGGGLVDSGAAAFLIDFQALGGAGGGDSGWGGDGGDYGLGGHSGDGGGGGTASSCDGADGGGFGNGGLGSDPSEPNSTSAGGGGGVGGGGGGIAWAGGGGGFGGGGGHGANGYPNGGSGGFGGGGAGGGFGGYGGGNGSDSGGSPRAGIGGGGAGMGGAIFNLNGTVTIRNSTLAFNAAVGGMAGGTPDFEPGIENGSGLGGAIFNLQGTVRVIQSTTAGNVASGSNTAQDPAGGALYSVGYLEGDDAGLLNHDATAVIINSILSDSTDGSSGAIPDLSTDQPDALVNGASNIAEATTSIDATSIVESSKSLGSSIVNGMPLNEAPLLCPLAYYGGPTLTMALRVGSPAIDAANHDIPNLPSTDQRGYPRVNGLSPDIGAYEFGDVGDVIFRAGFDLPYACP